MLATAYDQPVRTAATTAAIAACLALATPASGAIRFLRTPSNNIVCAYFYGADPIRLRCDVRSGLRPLPPRPAGCEFDWGVGYTLRARGRASVTCASDSVGSLYARVLRYGTTWRGGPLTCTSRRTGLRCRNASGHGFFLSRARSYRF